VAHWLQDQGVQAYAVRGGVAALLGQSSPGNGGVLVAPTVPVPTSRALAALRHRRFSLYSAGVLFSLIGNWVEAAAFGYVVLLLGGSAAALGVIGFLNTIPNIVFALPAGALADRYDRRKLLLVFQGANMGVAILLAVLWTTGELTVPLIGAIAIVGGTLGTLSFPAFQATTSCETSRRCSSGSAACSPSSISSSLLRPPESSCPDPAPIVRQ
jgi:MFS family permease